MFYGKSESKITAVILSMALIVGATPLSTFAAGDSGGALGQSGESSGVIGTLNGVGSLGQSGIKVSGTIIAAFEELDEDILIQGYGFGTEIDALNLPGSLAGTDENGNAITIHGVTWESTPAFDGTVAAPAPALGYEFTAVLPEEYALDEGVTAPVITVVIGQSVAMAVANGGTAAEISTYLNNWSGGGKLNTTVLGNTVTVTGDVTGEQRTIDLAIDAGVTVVWDADLAFDANISSSGDYFIQLSGDGTFEVASGRGITVANTGMNRSLILAHDSLVIDVYGEVRCGSKKAAIFLSDNTTLNVMSGGSVTTTRTDGKGVQATDNAILNVSGGDISATHENAYVVQASDNSKINIDAGTLSNASNAQVPVIQIENKASLKMTGGTMNAGTVWHTDTDAIYIASTDDSDFVVVEISGGNINCVGDIPGFAIRKNADTAGRGTVIISGGTITVNDTDGNGIRRAISYADGAVFLLGGTVQAQNKGNTTRTGAAAVMVPSGSNGGIVEWDGVTGSKIVGQTTGLTDEGVYDDSVLEWRDESGVGGIYLWFKDSNGGTYERFQPINGVTVAKGTQTTPVIVGGNISKKYGDDSFTLNVTGGESTGAYSFTNSNPAVATVSTDGLVTLGSGASAIGSTNITVKKMGDYSYYDSAESAPITLVVDKADQAAPIIEYTRTGDFGTEPIVITITNPSLSEAELSLDNFSTTENTNVFTYPLGMSDADLYARMKEDATHNASPVSHVFVDFAKQDQTAPAAFTMTFLYNSGPQNFTVTIPEVPGAEYSFNGSAFSSTRTTTASPGDAVTGYMRFPGSSTHNPSPVTSSMLTLPYPVTAITVEGAGGVSSITVNGGTLQMEADVQPALANSAVDWAISDGANHATISSTGLITATSDGTVTVRATATDGTGVYGETSIVISGQVAPTIPVQSITVGSTTDSITAKGGKLQMSAVVSPANADNKAVTWSVNNNALAVIDANGLLTAKANGTVKVTATAIDGSGITGNKNITISGQDTTAPTIPVTSITVNGAGGVNTIKVKGGTLQMGAGVQPANADNKAVTWSVNNTAIATISPTGLLTAKADGTVKVRATATDGSGVYGEREITISGQSNGGSGNNSGGGSSSSGGSSSGGSSKRDEFTGGASLSGAGSSTTNTTTTWTSTPSEPGKPSQSSGSFGVKAGDWKKFGDTSYSHDTVEGKSVQVRVTINRPSQLKNDTLLSGYTKGNDVDRVRVLFEKWYRNKIRVIHLEQQADWEQTVSIAAKVDLTGFDTNNLMFYAYDAKSNKYKRILNPNYRIDANGYLRFDTPYAGDIIVSEGMFEKK